VNVSVPKREGQALVLTFWKMTDKPSDKQIATLKDLYSAYGQEPKVAFVGVNSDGLNQTDVARSSPARRVLIGRRYTRAAARRSRSSSASMRAARAC